MPVSEFAGSLLPPAPLPRPPDEAEEEPPAEEGDELPESDFDESLPRDPTEALPKSEFLGFTVQTTENVPPDLFVISL